MEPDSDAFSTTESGMPRDNSGHRGHAATFRNSKHVAASQHTQGMAEGNDARNAAIDFHNAEQAAQSAADYGQ